jgi:hypothetical protein
MIYLQIPGKEAFRALLGFVEPESIVGLAETSFTIPKLQSCKKKTSSMLRKVFLFNSPLLLLTLYPPKPCFATVAKAGVRQQELALLAPRATYRIPEKLQRITI